MTSAIQIAANRRNAALSTGPKTAEGKAKCRLNAMKHGLLAEKVVTIADGELEEFFIVYTELHTEFDPVGRMETEMVDRIISLLWRLKRAMKIEQEILMDGVRRAKVQGIQLGHAFIQDAAGPDAMAKLSRYETTLERSLYRSLEELNKLQRQRKKEMAII